MRFQVALLVLVAVCAALAAEHKPSEGRDKRGALLPYTYPYPYYNPYVYSPYYSSAYYSPYTSAAYVASPYTAAAYTAYYK